MPVTLSRSGQVATITITVNVADIIAAVGLSASERRAQVMNRALGELSDSVRVDPHTDAEIDASVAARTEEANRMKATRATGGLT